MDADRSSCEARIREVIWAQLRALAALDGDRALSLLTPERRTGSGTDLLRALTVSFPVLTRARHAEFGTLHERAGLYAQEVRVTSWDQRHADATYLLKRRADGKFLIQGCAYRSLGEAPSALC